MTNLISIESLGPRICIMGPSNSGKSTLAEAISRRTALPTVHLDLLYHQPNTNWQPRDSNEFLQLHTHAIHQELWVMDGNYSQCIKQRLNRATGFILLDLSTTMSLIRYIRRCYSTNIKAGYLEGAEDKVNWKMLKHIALDTPIKRKGYKKMYQEISQPKLLLLRPQEVNECYKQWDL